MKRRKVRLIYFVVLLLLFAYILIRSATPVKVYTVQIQIKDTAQTGTEAKVLSQKPQSFQQNTLPTWKWTDFLFEIGVVALLGAVAGTVIGALSGNIHMWSSMLPGIFSGAAAGLVAGLILGGVSYIWEYYFGFEVMNKIYSLPESVLDFNRE